MLTLFKCPLLRTRIALAMEPRLAKGPAILTLLRSRWEDAIRERDWQHTG